MTTRGGPINLEGKVAVVTGAAQGLGEAIARLFSELDARLVLLDINEDGIQSLADEFTGAGKHAIALKCDVTSESSVVEVAQEANNRFGSVDILVNNAALFSWSAIESTAVEDWDKVFEVNLRGAFLCTKHFGKIMLAQNSGSIVNISSVQGSAPSANSGPYGVTKAGIIALSRLTAVEWGPKGIRSNALSPGTMNTPMAAKYLADPTIMEKRIAMIPSRRIAEPREVAQVIAFLASDASSYVNAQEIQVDGGLMQHLLTLLPHE
jgi:NAD(P)-dependent dehydrogenase (short-subunit alcohol dehydrogenase family)